MEFPENDKGFVGHLEELRVRLIISLISVIVVFCICFGFIDKISLFLQEPIKEYGFKLYYFKPYEKFMTYVKVDFIISFILCSPLFLYQAGAFIWPALKREEKKYLGIFMTLIPLIFFGGAFFSFTIIAPAALKFFIGFSAGDNVLPMWSFGEYFDMVIGFCVVTGMLFQMPFVMLLFIAVGVVSVKTISKYRKYIVIIIALFSGIFSPGPDIMSQIMVGVPLYMLFEISLIIGKIIELNRKKQ